MSHEPPLRSLPRLFVTGATADGLIELPKDEIEKLRKVLRLSAGAQIAVLPNDGTIIRCTFTGRDAEPTEVITTFREPMRPLTVAQALPKGDKLDEIVRACTEIGATQFVLFASERTVVRWDERKTGDRLNRLATIAREASEVCYRTTLPQLRVASSFAEVLSTLPDACVLSESEGETRGLPRDASAIVVGPEGGWSKREFELIGDRGVTLGPRVLRVDHAAPAAAAILLLSER